MLRPTEEKERNGRSIFRLGETDVFGCKTVENIMNMVGAESALVVFIGLSS